MKGYRTVSFGFAVFILPLLEKLLEKLQVTDLSAYIPKGYGEIALSGIGLVIVILRFLTTTPVGKKG